MYQAHSPVYLKFIVFQRIIVHVQFIQQWFSVFRVPQAFEGKQKAPITSGDRTNLSNRVTDDENTAARKPKSARNKKTSSNKQVMGTTVAVSQSLSQSPRTSTSQFVKQSVNSSVNTSMIDSSNTDNTDKSSLKLALNDATNRKSQSEINTRKGGAQQKSARQNSARPNSARQNSAQRKSARKDTARCQQTPRPGSRLTSRPTSRASMFG